MPSFISKKIVVQQNHFGVPKLFVRPNIIWDRKTKTINTKIFFDNYNISNFLIHFHHTKKYKKNRQSRWQRYMINNLHSFNFNELFFFSVCNDILQVAFNRKFINEIFTHHQPIYSKKVLKAMFERLAHASTIRVTPESLDKVIFLMSLAAHSLIC